MKDWKKTTLGEVCDISSSKRIFAREYEDTGIPFYRSKEIIEKHNGVKVSNELFISEERYNTIKEKHGVPVEGDLLLTSVGTLGVSYVVKKEEVFYFKDGNLTWFRNFTNLNSSFLYYWFHSPSALHQISSKCIGSTQKALTIDTLRNFEFNLPLLNEQKRIVDVLSALDDKIEVNNKINDNLEKQAQAIFKQWFVDFEFPDKEGNTYKTNGGEFIDSELGEIPLGWKVGVLTDIGNVVAGGTPSKAKDEYFTDNGIAWVTPKDLSLQQTKFISKGLIDITIEGLEKSSAKLMPRGTVLFTSRAPIGYIAVAKNEISTNQGFKSVTPIEPFNTAFIYYYLLYNTQMIENMSSGSTFKEASGALMKSLEVIMPNEDILTEYKAINEIIFQQQEVLEEENKNLSELRDYLLPKLMSGEVRV